MKTVAIIGSHPRTREAFDFDRTDCDIWVFNEALGNQNWCKRATGVFQIHKPVIWRSSVNRNDPKHYDWLKSGETPIVYMQDKYDDVPKSERYPIDEILEQFPRGYFTSSVSYALALAVYLKYDRMEVYGVEMETQTEYGHQRNAVAYWIGYAEGMGMEVEMHSKGFFESLLYGYEGEARIPLEHYQERITHFEGFCKDAQAAYEKAKDEVYRTLDSFVRDYKTDLSQLEKMLTNMGQNAHNFGAVDGGRQMNELYLSKCEKMIEETGTYLIVKQEYESAAHASAGNLQEKLQQASIDGAALVEKHKALYTNLNMEIRTERVADFKVGLDKWIRSNTESGIMNGSQMEARHFMAKIDELVKMAGGKEVAELLQEVKA